MKNNFHSESAVELRVDRNWKQVSEARDSIPQKWPHEIAAFSFKFQKQFEHLKPPLKLHSNILYSISKYMSNINYGSNIVPDS